MKKPVNLPLKEGSKIGRYTVIRKLSSGGFGIVYLATREDGQPVAIKEFLPQHIPCRYSKESTEIKITDEKDIMRFKEGLDAFFKEADTLAKINDERVIAVWDVFAANSTGYFVMPVEKGCTLHTLLKQSGRMGDSTAQRFFIEASQGVKALHEKGLLHLDLKPGNLWVRPDGSLVVLDLGASRWVDDEARSTQLAKTPGFAAPEQYGIKNLHRISEKTDIYGLAASLYNCLEGAPPPAFPKRDEGALLSVSRLGQRNHELLNVIDKGMAINPEHRYQNMEEVLVALQSLPRLRDDLYERRDPFKTTRRNWKILSGD